MKEILITSGYHLYEESCNYKVLVDKTLEKFYDRKVNRHDLPINPFEILERSGVIYSFMDFKDLEGFYLLPKDNEPGVVGINRNRPISRQRFTAAHELCHHLKDEETLLCKNDMKDEIEVYANKFASELLMPSLILEEILLELKIKKDDLDSVLKVSVMFGVSFQSALIKISNYYGWKYTNKTVSGMSRAYKPDKKKRELNLSSELVLWKQVINSYQFLNVNPPRELKTQFLNYVIENDHRLENGTLTGVEIRQILMKIRHSEIKKESYDISSLDDNEIEVIGQYHMYENIFTQSIDKQSYLYFLSLHKKFYLYAPHPEVGGAFRDGIARISGTKVKTTDPRNISMELYDFCQKIDNGLQTKINLSQSDLINEIVCYHHVLTVIHPFYDGNGRTIRAFSNSLLLFYDIPPIFILEREKSSYRNGLKDMDNNVIETKSEKLLEFILKKIVYNYSHFISDSSD